MALTQARYDHVTDIVRAIWDPTEGFHSRHGERSLGSILFLEVHWTGAGGDLLDHLDTADELLSFERHHEETKEWYDLFYNWAADSEGFIYEGRDMTIPSQGSLRTKATLLLVQGTDQRIAPGEPDYLNFARAIYRAWGAVDSERNPATLQYHQERSSTSCPGRDIIQMIDRLRSGWIPPGADMADHTHKYMDLSAFADAEEAKGKGFWDGSDPTGATSRSVAAVMVNRADKQAQARENVLLDQIKALQNTVSTLQRRLDDLPAPVPGPRGPTGKPGPRGLRGATGLKGDPGLRGDPGEMAPPIDPKVAVDELVRRFTELMLP